MSDYTPTAEVSLDRLADLLSETNAQLAELREPLSDERFRDECAMRAAVYYAEADDDGSSEQVARWSFDLADAMLAERKRRRG